MTDTAADISLAPLVEKLVAFLRERPEASQPPWPKRPFPGDLTRARESFGHHLIPLMLLARSDGKAASKEREAIISYCVARAKRAGMEMTAAEIAALEEDVRHFHPTEMQLNWALRLLHNDSKEDIAALLAAAHAVVVADGIVRLQEALFLDELKRDLAAL